MKNTLPLLQSIITFCLVLLGHALQAQVTGTVFRDFDGDGIRDTNEPLIAGVTVNAYLANGTTPCGTAITSGSAAPNYTLSGCGTAAVRVEFVLPTSGFCANSGIDFTSFVGSGNGTSVQFVNGNSTNVNFALHNPNDYNQGTTGVSVFIPCYISGDPLVAGDVANGAWFVGYPYTNSGSTPKPAQMVGGSIIGPTWGVAYSKQAKKIFTSALVKRHVGLGQSGSGGIYLLTPTSTSFTASSFYDLDANGHRTRAASTGVPAYGQGTSYSIASDNATITYLGSNDPLTGRPAGLGVIGTNGTNRGLTNDPLDPSFDPAAFDQVGKVGLGDIDISDDGKFLFVMNLYSRKVFRLELNSASNPTSVVAVTSYDVPAPTCTNGTYRPWGLKFHRNRLYVGVVCSGENGGTAANLTGSVYELNNPTASATFNTTALVTFPLNYDRPEAHNPWTNNSNIDAVGNIRYATPLLSDIEFTDNGDMLLGIMDRSGHQWGEQNYRFLKTSTNTTTIAAAGDVLVAGLNCTTGAFALENNGTFTSANGATFSGINTNSGEGPGGRSFFDDNSNVGDPHDETALGALALLKGQGQILLPAYAQTGNSGDAGTMKLSTTNGSFVNYYELYYRENPPGIFAKANGLGDVELTGIESPIEIGNRVWRDTDSDGIQDAGEPALAGVSVSLCTGAGVPISTAVTDASGNYYFSSGSGTTTTSARYSLTALTPNTAFQVKFPSSTTAGLLSTANTGSNDGIDSDPAATGVVAFTTGEAGANNHSFDAGYGSASCSLTLTALPGTCNPLTNQYTVTGSISLTGNTTGGTATITDGARSSTVTVAANATSVAYSLTGLSSGATTHTVTVSLSGCGTASTTYLAPAICTTAQSCNCKEYIYLNEPQIGSVLKFEISSNLLLKEVLGANGGTLGTHHWYPGTNTTQLPNPHGLATDLNGNLYIGHDGQDGILRKFNCDGVISATSINTIVNDGPNQNIFSIGNILYVNTDGGPTAYNTCTGAKLGQVCLAGAPTPGGGIASNLWGLSYNPTTERVYATQRSGNQQVWVFTRAQLEAGIAGTGSCITALVTEGPSATVTPGQKFLPNGRGQVMGVTSDNSGNFYVVFGLSANANFIAKYNANGEFIAESANGVRGTDPYGNAIGIVWSETTNRLYMTNFIDDNLTDCISAFDANTLAYIGAAAPNPGPSAVGDNRGKAIAILKECCPVNLPTSFNKNVCSGVGAKLYLNQEAFDTCDGIVCGSSWTPVGTPTGMTFDACDNSVLITGIGCATFSLNIGNVSSTSCGPQSSVFTICSTAPDADATFSQTAATCTANVPNNNGILQLSTINGTHYGISAPNATTYNGPSTIMGATAVPTVPITIKTGLPNAGVTYIIRIFKGSDNCFVDKVVTVLPSSCASPSLAVVVGIPVCNTATNSYTATGTVSLTNATAGSLTITDNGSTIAVVSVTAGQTSASFSVSGVSGSSPASHSVVARLSSTTASTIYATPASCAGLVVMSASVCAGGTTSISATGCSQAVTWSAGGTPNGNVLTINTTANSPTLLTFTATCATSGLSATGTVTVYPAVTATIGGNRSICQGQSTTLTASGGVTYRWSTGATTAMISVSVAGTYSVTATSAQGCSNTATATVVVNPLPTVMANSAAICAGQSATLLASGANTYLWSTGSAMASIVVSPTATTTYSVTGTTTAGCSASGTGTVLVNGQPQINSINQSTACVGTVASLTVNVTNTGAGTLEYSLNGGAFQSSNSFTINAASSTTATIVVRTQGSSCSATESVVVNCACFTPVSLTFVPTTLQTCAGSPISFTVGVSGASSATLTTSGTGTFSQNVISGNTTVIYTPSMADATAGSITLTLTSADPDGAGACVADQVTRMLTISPLPSVSVASVSVCAGEVAMLMASGASTYRWSTGATTQSISVSVAGVYSVTGTSSAGCSATAAGSVTLYSALSLSPASLPTATVGAAYSQTITLTGGMGSPIFTSTGTLPAGLGLNAATGVISGTPTTAGESSFTVKVTDGRSCSALLPLSLTVTAAPVASLGDYVFADNNRDGIQDGGDSPIQSVTVTLYLNGSAIATTTTSISGLYSFTGLTPGNSLSYSVGFTTPVGYTATTPNAPGSTTANDSDANPVTGRTQSVTLASGENNPTLDAGFWLLDNLQIRSSTVCAGSPASLTLLGCTGSIQWSGPAITSGANTSILSVSTSAASASVQVLSYTATCSTSGSMLVGTVTVNPAVTATISGNLSICAGNSTSLTASGGATYRWNMGATTTMISVSIAGPYSVTATSSAGCSATATATVVVSPLPTVMANSATICAGQSATLLASGANTYQWSNGSAMASIVVSPTATTVYSVTGFTDQGCANVGSGTVTVNGQPQINSINQSTACVGTVASLTVNATNTGAGTLEYSLNGGAFQSSNSFTINAASSTTATIVVRTQGSSCSATESVVVNCACFTPVSLTFVPTTLQTCAGSPISFTVGVSGASSATLTTSGTGTFSQNVISGNTTVIYTPSMADATAGSVTLTLTSADPDGAGACVADQVTRMLTISPLPSVSVASVSVCVGDVAELMASGASTYRWSTGATTQSISVSVAGVYSVTGTSSAGCSATAAGSVTLQPTPTLTLQRKLIVNGMTAVLSASGCTGGTINWSTDGAGLPATNQSSITVAAPFGTRQSYTAICTTTSGCSALATILLDREPGGGELAVNNAVVCATASALLSASGCTNGSLLWSTGATTRQISVPGASASYTVVCTDALGTQEAVASVSAVAAPSLTLTASPSQTVMVGSNVTLTVSGCNSGTVNWSAGINGQMSAVVSPTLGSNVYSVTCTVAGGCSATSQITVVGTQAAQPQLVLKKVVSQSRAKLGEVVNYTVTLANTGAASATGVVVSDTYTAGVSLVPGSVSASTGSFTPGASGGQWAIASLPAGATATLTFSASLTQEGISFNTASIPNQEVKVCTTVPVLVCKGQPFEIQLGAPAGYNRYQWYLTTPGGTTLVSDITATSLNASTAGNYTATVAGEYSVRINEGVAGSCPDGSCCPAIIEEVEVPSYTTLVRNPSCVGGSPQPNGQVTLVNLGADPGKYVYQVSRGASFSTTQVLSGTATTIPTNGVVATGLLPGNYAIRVWVLIEGQPSCPRDLTVAVVENCACPEEVCLPVIIRKTKSQGKSL